MAERWDRDRFERARGEQPRDRFDDDRSYTRSTRGRDHSDERYDRRPGRGYYEEDDAVRDRRHYGDEPRHQPQMERERERDFPPPWARRTDVLERERERDQPRRASPARRPGFLRRQSSLDTFDRRPRFFQEREEYPAPARREDVRPRDHRDPRDDYRPPPYMPIPLPKSRGLPPPRQYGDEYYDDIKVAEPDHYGDDDYRSMPERVREKEYTRSRKSRGRGRDRSRESRSTKTHSVRSSSYGSSSRSSSSSGGTTVKSEYPKKGKTRIPAKLVSKRALIDLGYPFFEEGNTIIVQKALGQDNIDELLKVSEDYKKVEAEIAASREPKAPTAALPAPPPREAREPTPEPPPARTPEPPTPAPPPVQLPPVQPPMQHAPPPPMPPMMQTPAPPPIHMQPPMQMQPPPMHSPMPPMHTPMPPMQTPMPPMAQPGPPPSMYYQPGPPPPQTAYDSYEETVIREVSPSRSATTMTSWDSYHRDSYHHHHQQPEELVVRARSQSRGGRDIRREIKALERELTHRPRGRSTSGDMVRAERLPDGQLIIREERLEKVVEHRKPPRIEKDKKGPPPKLMRAMLATLT
ncbi:hypothetical protein ACHAPU_002395 [Fusarium lateritium]